MTYELMMQPGSAVIDLYLAALRLRAWVPMRGFSRISDMLNSGDVNYLSANLPPNQQGAPGREVALRLSAVNLVRPIEESPGAPASRAEYRDRERVHVVIEMDGCHVVGHLYLVDRVRWVDFLPAVRERFVAVTRASVTFAEPRLEPLESDFLLVNGARITALWTHDD